MSKQGISDNLVGGMGGAVREPVSRTIDYHLQDNRERPNESMSSSASDLEIVGEPAKEKPAVVIWPAAYSRGASLRLVRNPLQVAGDESDR